MNARINTRKTYKDIWTLEQNQKEGGKEKGRPLTAHGGFEMVRLLLHGDRWQAVMHECAVLTIISIQLLKQEKESSNGAKSVVESTRKSLRDCSEDGGIKEGKGRGRRVLPLGLVLMPLYPAQKLESHLTVHQVQVQLENSAKDNGQTTQYICRICLIAMRSGMAR